jgi:excisionase family DNA binding protein
MEHTVEKLLYSRRDAAEALSLSIRSVDYLITAGRLTARRVGGKILIPASVVRRFAREDHPDSVRFAGVRVSTNAKAKRQASVQPITRFGPGREVLDGAAPMRANGRV